MSSETPFKELIRRVRVGDAEAAAELVRRYEPAIRVAVRVRLTNNALRQMFDSMDICQSILASFFVRAAAGRFELDEPEQLLKLLVQMTQNKVVDQARKHRAARRDYRRVARGEAVTADLRDRQPSPSEQITHRDLLEHFRARLSETERLLADLRGDGRSWDEIAAEFGEPAAALRMRLTRAVDRVSRELGL